MLEEVVRRAGRAFGLEIRRRTSVSDPIRWLARQAKAHNVSTIVDVGANTGQFAKSMLDSGWKDRVVSFEPLTAAHNELVRSASSYPNWEIAPRCAIGASRSSCLINIAGNSQSSSLLPMLDRHTQAAPSSAYTGKESVEVLPLDDIELPGDRLLLKMDVQGFEQHVLSGAQRTLERVTVVFTEMSLQPLYRGEALFTELSENLLAMGYRCVGIRPGYFDPRTEEILQVDATFVR